MDAKDLSQIKDDLRQKISLYVFETFPGDSLKDEMRRKNFTRVLYDRVLTKENIDLFD
jgi:hypothetical protein